MPVREPVRSPRPRLQAAQSLSQRGLPAEGALGHDHHGERGPQAPGCGRGNLTTTRERACPCPLGVKMQQVSWSLMEAPKGPQDGSLHESISVDLVLGTWMLTLCGLPLSPPSSSSFSLTSHLSLRTKNKAGPPSLLERMALAVFVSTSH